MASPQTQHELELRAELEQRAAGRDNRGTAGRRMRRRRGAAARACAAWVATSPAAPPQPQRRILGILPRASGLPLVNR